VKWLLALLTLPVSLPYLVSELVPEHLQDALGERLFGEAYHSWLPCRCHGEDHGVELEVA
jgi:hypothetical protein